MSAYAYPVAAAITISFGVASTLASLAPSYLTSIQRLLIALVIGLVTLIFFLKRKAARA